jgi:polysaccharide export outer membrane protein
MRGFAIVAAVSVLLLGLGGASAQEAKPGAQVNGTVDLDEYRIGVEDVLQIFVWKNDTLSRVVSVRPDGKISLPLLGDVEAAGKTTRDLREMLVKRFTEFIAAPEISVIVNEIKSIKVSVIGEVPKPGRYELKSRTTVLDMVALAGGFGPFASRGKMVVLRPEGGKMKRIPFNFNRAVSEGGEQENFYLQPGDIVVVP